MQPLKGIKFGASPATSCECSRYEHVEFTQHRSLEGKKYCGEACDTQICCRHSNERDGRKQHGKECKCGVGSDLEGRGIIKTVHQKARLYLHLRKAPTESERGWPRSLLPQMTSDPHQGSHKESLLTDI